GHQFLPPDGDLAGAGFAPQHLLAAAADPDHFASMHRIRDRADRRHVKRILHRHRPDRDDRIERAVLADADRLFAEASAEGTQPRPDGQPRHAGRRGDSQPVPVASAAGLVDHPRARRVGSGDDPLWLLPLERASGRNPGRVMNHTAPLVRATNLSKRFKIYPKPNGRLIEWLTGGRVQRHADFWALRGLDMTLYRGECLGIVGANGSGKSTFLKILAGTLTPTSGSCSVDGKVMAILELGTGFNRELTGRQNIHLAAQLLGIGADYVNQKMPDIEAFAALGEFMDRPIKLYSSGMQARLAFSLFAFLEPDVLIVDEALAVGDISFQRKCYRHMEQMIGSGRQAVIFVTHDLHAVTKLCTRAIWLRNGHVELEGEPPEVVERYQRFMLNGEEGIATTASRR